MSKYEEYLICQKRKHQASGLTAGSYNVCKFCGTKFKFVTKVEEVDAPTKS